MIYFKERIKQLRTERGMSQKELADLLNVSKSTISGYETGAYQPSFDNLIRLANIFNVAVDYFYTNLRKPLAKYKNGVRVPVISQIPANIDIIAELSDISDKTPLDILYFKKISPKYKANYKKYFIFEQSNILYTIQSQSTASDGNTVLACIGKNTADIYSCKYEGATQILVDASNNTYAKDIKIIGIAVDAAPNETL